MYTDTTGEKYGTKHTEDEEPCLDKNRTKETGNFHHSQRDRKWLTLVKADYSRTGCRKCIQMV